MGLFVRRDGRQSHAPSRGESRQLSAGQPAWLAGSTEVRVAGESFHQAAIGALQARSSPGSPLVAVLVPEPENGHDPNALAVHVNAQHVGYLPRDVAWRVRPALAAFSHAHGGCLVACTAEVRRHDNGPQVVLLIDPLPLGLRAEDFAVVPDMAATIRRLLARLDEPSPPLSGVDRQARSSLTQAQEDLEETDANRDRGPGDWPRVEAALHRVADQLVKAGDPYASTAWLALGRAIRYQRGRRDDALAALIEALYWDRGNARAWSELVDLASAAPHVPTLLALYARIPFGSRAGVLSHLLSMSEQHDRMGRLDPIQGEILRKGLRDLAESQGDKASVAALSGHAGLAAEKAGDIDAAVRWWRLAVAAGSTDARVADRFSTWLVKSHAYQEAARVLQQALAADPGSAQVAERMERRLARCQQNSSASVQEASSSSSATAERGDPPAWRPRAGWGTVRSLRIASRGNGRADLSFYFVPDDGGEPQLVELIDSVPPQELGEYARGVIGDGQLKIKVDAETMAESNRVFSSINQMGHSKRKKMFADDNDFYVDAGWTWTSDYTLVKAAPGLVD